MTGLAIAILAGYLLIGWALYLERKYPEDRE